VLGSDSVSETRGSISELTLEDLFSNNQNSRRAFAVIPRESDNYFSSTSARKMLEVGIRVKDDFSYHPCLRIK
jgi:hypothetical protein